MLRTAALGLSLILVVAGIAQPPNTIAPTWGNLPYLTQVNQAANQLFNHVEKLKTFCASLRHPQAPALQRMVDAYYEEILRFSRFLARTPARPQIEQEYRRLDRRGDDVLNSLRAFASSTQNAALLQLVSRVEYADQQLAAAVIGGGSTPPPAGNLVRLTRSLDSQSDEL